LSAGNRFKITKAKILNEKYPEMIVYNSQEQRYEVPVDKVSLLFISPNFASDIRRIMFKGAQL
jgi:hypothetical protein